MPARPPGARNVQSYTRRDGTTVTIVPNPERATTLLLNVWDMLSKQIPAGNSNLSSLVRWFTSNNMPIGAKYCRQYVRAYQHKWFLAADIVRKKFETLIGIMHTYRGGVLEQAAPYRMQGLFATGFSSADLYAVVRELQVYFGDRFSINVQQPALEVVTEPIKLVDWVSNTGTYNLGQFLIRLSLCNIVKWLRGEEEIAPEAFRFTPLQPKYSKSSGSYCHPHLKMVSGSSIDNLAAAEYYICSGDGRAAIINALKAKRWGDAFELICSVLNTYGDSPFHPLGAWNIIKCRSCERTFDEKDAVTFTCACCNTPLGCPSCRVSCGDCKHVVCRRCIIAVGTYSSVCKSCAYVCRHCKKSKRKSTITGSEQAALDQNGLFECDKCLRQVSCVSCNCRCDPRELDYGICRSCNITYVRCMECGCGTSHNTIIQANNVCNMCNSSKRTTCASCGTSVTLTADATRSKSGKYYCNYCKNIRCTGCKSIVDLTKTTSPVASLCVTCVSNTRACHRCHTHFKLTEQRSGSNTHCDKCVEIIHQINDEYNNTIWHTTGMQEASNEQNQLSFTETFNDGPAYVNSWIRFIYPEYDGQRFNHNVWNRNKQPVNWGFCTSTRSANYAHLASL